MGRHSVTGISTEEQWLQTVEEWLVIPLEDKPHRGYYIRQKFHKTRDEWEAVKEDFQKRHPECEVYDEPRQGVNHEKTTQSRNAPSLETEAQQVAFVRNKIFEDIRETGNKKSIDQWIEVSGMRKKQEEKPEMRMTGDDYYCMRRKVFQELKSRGYVSDDGNREMCAKSALLLEEPREDREQDDTEEPVVGAVAVPCASSTGD